jgi:predicted Rossmann fold flavoprotein
VATSLPPQPDADVLVVGAGAAGLLAAIAAASRGARTVLVDRRRKVGAKILISGGSGCIVTTVEVRESDFYTPSPPFVRTVLRQFPPERARAFFEEHGVALKLEPTGKYFPVSDSARDVLAGLLGAAAEAGVDLRREALVTEVRHAGGHFVATGDATIAARAVVLATGGLSYPETGSDGVGYRIARAFGHRVETTSPALTPLVAAGQPHAYLSGITVDATLTLWVDNRKALARTGSFLFTHTGYSGPVARDVSRHWVRRGWTAPSGVRLTASFAGERTAEEVEAAWLAEARRAPSRHVASLLADFVPHRLAEALAAEARCQTDRPIGQATRDERRRTVAALTALELPVTDVAGYRKAEVTAGGVALDEVLARSLESKLRRGLFFAGEILDVDGYIGGFNFQWAWSSGWVAGRSAAEHAAEHSE